MKYKHILCLKKKQRYIKGDYEKMLKNAICFLSKCMLKVMNRKCFENILDKEKCELVHFITEL